ncbi:hypothetical protein BN946_scf185015.g118 [Trametes cinnabarina]|uniref:Btz domain-containing protein n=1 Tax=Pycnoporus cinnabarinus TaxID=5643 RepID=A0A060SNN1_PYCCI|nr:hypothetical protein BN946_scf185015.g118 [Trametes cinnabarina]
MPTAVAASSSDSRKPIERSMSNPIPKRRRPVKRRGRAKDEFESDDDIEREVRTDSETDDDHSSIDSESDSESSSDDLHADAQSEVVTPSTTQSPPPVELASLPNGSSKDGAGSHAAIFADTTNWAEMVADEAANGASSLPVIDFADMDSARLESQPRASSPAPRSRKNHKSGKKAALRATSAPPRPAVPPTSEGVVAAVVNAEETVASTLREREPSQSSAAGRSRNQSARQAYQQRLESDPSFVPKVGEFWGHDDRLLDKELRSLSGWWRGRWQSRGRARGGLGFRGRGRGFYAQPGFSHEEGSRNGEPPIEQDDVPPVERQWTHDGFEEMKKRDERRCALQEQQQQQRQQEQTHTGPVRGFGFRGRGFVPARGRGGFGRGGVVSPANSLHPLSNVAMGERVWYAQKPEKMWTKQHDIFLYQDMDTKPRPGLGPGVKVKLPGSKEPTIVRLPRRSFAARAAAKREPMPAAQDDGEHTFTVRLPSRGGQEKAAEEVPAVPEVLATTGEEISIDEIFTVRPHLVPNRRVDLAPSPTTSTTVTEGSQRQVASEKSSLPVKSSPTTSHAVSEETRNPLEQIIVPAIPVDDGRTSPSPIIQEIILRYPPTTSEDGNSGTAPATTEEPRPQRPAPPMLHPLQTSFSPVPQTTPPPYGSPYAYGPALPPGVAVNHQGMAYEYATGRPVYIQPTPPPMFTPRPMMHTHHPSLAMPFVPSHLRHHSVASPEYMAHPHTPPVPAFIDPVTGVPIFAPPRQSSRIEIRAPTDAAEGKKSSRSSHHRSALSTSSVTASANENEQSQSYYPAQEGEASAQDGASDQQHQQPPDEYSQAPQMEPAMAYAPYPQAYYYPEQYGYGPYVDMSQQVMPYEAYAPSEHHNHHHSHSHSHSHSQPVVYY